jgi:hypothetical protein
MHNELRLDSRLWILFEFLPHRVIDPVRIRRLRGLGHLSISGKPRKRGTLAWRFIKSLNAKVD